MQASSIDELFRRTLEGDYEDDLPWAAVHELRHRGSREVFDIAKKWCFSADPLRRARGLDVIAQLGRSEGHIKNAFPEESFALVSTVIGSESDPLPLNSAIRALGHLDDERAVPLIIQFSEHPSDDIRFAVACALGKYPDHPDSVAALLGLMRDSDDDVRDWATFALGVLGASDSDEVRAALARALDDSDQDVRDEALAGLAKRKDPRALPPLLDALQHEAVTDPVIEAARSLLGIERDREEWTTADYAAALHAKFPG
jgi:HEAT repeat protein